MTLWEVKDGETDLDHIFLFSIYQIFWYYQVIYGFSLHTSSYVWINRYLVVFKVKVKSSKKVMTDRRVRFVGQGSFGDALEDLLSLIKVTPDKNK